MTEVVIGVTTLQEQYQSLGDEYEDLEEEFSDCNDKDERCRCARRMNQIIDRMTTIRQTKEL